MANKTTVPAASADAQAAAAQTTEEQPQRGGSFLRNADGTLTQTEGHAFANEQNESKE